ncbi:MAG: hypothetical protein Q7R33_04685 [Nitrosarchaeum sp.]|nr:hypothetical protein [Nitrosarchaeum sp.]
MKISITYHDDPPCTSPLINGQCPKCKITPDMQSTAIKTFELTLPKYGPVIKRDDKQPYADNELDTHGPYISVDNLITTFKTLLDIPDTYLKLVISKLKKEIST